MGLGRAFYSVLKFAVALWHPFGNNKNASWHIQMRRGFKKYVLANVEFMRRAPNG
jgi:hypothetical protein